MESYLSVLVKRLRPQADEINAYLEDGVILGYARGIGGALASWPTMAEFEAEWTLLQTELSAPAPSILSMEERLASLEERQHLSEDTLLEAIAGGML